MLGESLIARSHGVFVKIKMKENYIKFTITYK